jgi:integrase
MPKNKRVKTKYHGVFYLEVPSRSTGELERIYHIRYRTPDRKMVEERVGSSTRNMTAAKARDIRSDKLRGKELPNREQRRLEREKAARWTVEKLWEEYKDQKGNYPSLRTDKSNFAYIRPLFGKREPHEIAPLDIDRLKRKTKKRRADREEKLAPQTTKHILNLLQKVIRFGVRKGLCKSPTFAIEKPRVNNVKTEDLTPEQMQNLLKALDEEADIQVVNMMKMVLYTGARRGELFKLRWDDIDCQRGFITLRDPKGRQDQKIPLNGPSRTLLESHPRTESAFVFPGRGGKQRTEARVAANRIRKEAGLPPGFRPFHGLRHVFASMLASSGEVDMYTLQKLLTHKSPQMTQRYAHLRDEALRKASDLAGDLVDRAINGAKTTKEDEKSAEQAG